MLLLQTLKFLKKSYIFDNMVALLSITAYNKISDSCNNMLILGNKKILGGSIIIWIISKP